MKRHLLLAVALCAIFLAPQAARAQISIDVVPSVGPNPYNSPSTTGYNNAALYSLSGGLTGSPSGPGPTAYSPSGMYFGTNQLVSTTIPSWMGLANPGAPYANEHGNAVYFGAAITTNYNMGTMTGTLFSLSNVSFSVNSTTDPANLNFNSGTNPLPSTYTSSLVGVLPNGSLTTPGVTPASTLVQALYYVGPSDAYSSNATNQSQLSSDVSSISAINGGPVNLSGTFTVGASTNFVGGSNVGAGGSFSGSATATGVVPEPGSMAILGIGIIGIFGYVYRRQHRVSSVA